MKKIIFISFLLLATTPFTGCRKDNTRNIILDRDYKLQKFIFTDQNGNITDLLNSVFPGVADQVIIRFERDGSGSLTVGDQSNYTYVNNVVIVNGYEYGNWWSNTYYNNNVRPINYGFTWYYTGRRDGLGLNFNIDPKYYNTQFGSLLVNLSGEYSVKRINGLRIGANETIEISKGGFSMIFKKVV